MADKLGKEGIQVPQLVTEGVSEYLTDYRRPGYTEDALRQFVVLDDIEAKGRGRGTKRKRQQEDDDDDDAEGEEGDESNDDEQGDDDDGEGDGDGDGDDDGDTMSEGSSYKGSDNSDVPLDEVDMMLEEGLPEDYKIKTEKVPNGKYFKKVQAGPYVNRRLQVVDEIFSNPFDVLPEGWVRVTHNTGIPIYLHKESRVCTASMPYFLGPGSARKHRVPLSAIPCLQYRKALEKEKADVERCTQKNGAEESDKCEEGKENGVSSEANEKVDEHKVEVCRKGSCDKNAEPDSTSVGVGNKSNDNVDAGVGEVKAEERAENEKSGDGGTTSAAQQIKCPNGKSESKEGGDRPADKQSAAEPGKVGDEVAAAGKIGALPELKVEGNSTKGSNATPVVASALPKARIETAQENQETQSINHIELREYCQKLFRYRTIDVMRFKTWSERRRFAKVKKKERQLQRPSLPEGTKLITFPIMEPGDDSTAGSRMRREWIMNPNGKSYVCILHECVQHALKTQPVYEFRDLENPATPYSATVSINKMKYGTGVGTSKRQAKSEAARATLEVLIPEMREKMDEDSYRGGAGLSRNQHTDLSFFDDIKIQDPRVHEFCAKTTEPSPYTILLNCLKRNFGLGDMDITTEVKMLRHQKNEFTMSVGNHTATVTCKNKREGKQRASQAILQAMHPHITSWGSLLRLYGNRSVKTLREKKQEEQEITTLQSRASANSPNWAILDKLKEAMLKLKERNAAVKPLGKFIPPSNVDLPLASASNLNNLEL